jgi:tetratricopeptide (TPR) repeat protein
MELTNFIAWSAIVVTALGIGLGTMAWAYVGKGSISVLFKEPILNLPEFPATEAGSKASVYFQQGIEAYQLGNYRKAKDKFSSALQLISTLAEAYHNRALVFANLRSDDEAVADLIRASELYQQQGNGSAIALVKQNLEALKQRKLEREKQKAITTG